MGGSGGGVAIAGGTACDEVSLVFRGGVGKGALLGGGGGTFGAVVLSPVNGGGTPNLGFDSSSSIAVLGGLGGGGGPGFARFDDALGLEGNAGPEILANLPASASGGGALNFGRGGDGERSCGGDAGGEGALAEKSRLEPRAGGGAGGGPFLEDPLPPVSCGLIDCTRFGGAEGGGNGGGWLRGLSFSSSAALLTFFCSIYSLMKSAFSSI